MSGLILVSVAVSYLTLRLVTLLTVCGTWPGLYETLSNFIVLLKFVNSITNPLIYMITTRQFRLAVSKIISKRTWPPSIFSVFPSSPV